MLAIKWILNLLLLLLKHQIIVAPKGQTKQSVFQHIECIIHDKDAVPIFDCELVPDSNNVLIINMNMTYGRDLRDVMARLKTDVRRDGACVTFLSMELNICEALGRLYKNFILDMVIDEARRVTDLPIQCPIKKGNYHMREFRLNSKYLPPYVPELNWTSEMIFISQRKTIFEFRAAGVIVVQGGAAGDAKKVQKRMKKFNKTA